MNQITVKKFIEDYHSSSRFARAGLQSMFVAMMLHAEALLTLHNRQ